MSIADISEERMGGPREHERTPPHDLLAEQSALGGMLLSKDAVADVIESLRGADFYIPKHELIFEAILTLYSHGEPTDVVAVTDELIKTGELQRAGGADYLHTLTSIVPTAANAGYYASIVAERALLRRLVEAGTRIVQMGYSGQGEALDLVNNAQAEIYGVTGAEAAEDYVPLDDRRRRGDRRDRSGARSRRSDDRHPDRLLGSRPAHQRPAPRADDHHRGATRDG